MFEFESNCELFGVELKTSKKNNSYVMLTILSDNGKTVDVMYDGDNLDFTKLLTRRMYKFYFKLTLGRYQHFTVSKIDCLED